MGIHSDTLEDNVEAHDPWAELHHVVRSWATSSAPVPTVAAPIFPCQVCAQTFAAPLRLTEHLFGTHRTDRFFVRVNGRPSLEVHVSVEPLTSIEVVPLGSSHVDIEVSIDGELAGRLTATAGIPTEILAGGFGPVGRGLVTVRARTGRVVRTYMIYVRTAPPMLTAHLDALVNAAQAPLGKGGAADWNTLLAAARERGLSSLERRYLSGFGEYLLALHLDQTGSQRDAARALERAWGRLIPFGTDLARSAISVIAFRMDALEFLVSGATRSALAPVAGYLMSPPRWLTVVAKPRARSGIWIDDYQEALVSATHHALNGGFEAALAALRSAPSALRSAAGNQRKALILEARLTRELGDLAAMRSAYSGLQHDPVYGEEATVALA